MLAKQRRSAVFRTLCTASVSLACSAGVHALGAQVYGRLDLGWGIEVGGESERYARLMQLAGLTPLEPFSLQPFTPSQVKAMRPRTSAHPWTARFQGVDTSATLGLVLAPQARVIGNTTYAAQVSGGPTWAGRGLTADGQAGVAGEWNFVYGEFAPIAFVAQNAAFPLAPTVFTTGPLVFGDPKFSQLIDAPQRFGSGVYSRLDAGTSSLALDRFGAYLALSSAPQRWGPQRDFPLVLGPNAGGFPALMVGTSEPVNLYLLRLHLRAVYGMLTQSHWAPPDSLGDKRAASGLVVVMQPRGLNGLELGASRFIHRRWRINSVTFTRPFSGIINREDDNLNEDLENQVASLFARWAIPKARSEFYGEFYKEDYPGVFRHGAGSLVEAPDDLASFALGFQHMVRADSSGFRVLRAEVVNGESNHQERLERGFIYPQPPYIHGVIRQGHTLNGLILGSPEAYGGSGWRLGIDDVNQRGRLSFSLERMLRLDFVHAMSINGQVEPDVSYGLRGEWYRFTKQGAVGLTLIPAIDLNRNLEKHNDVFNLTAAFSWRGW
jgi:hypothetical protein